MITSAGNFSPLPLRPAGAVPSADSAPETKVFTHGADRQEATPPASTAGREPIRPLVDGGLLAAVQQQDAGNATSRQRGNGATDDGDKQGEDKDANAEASEKSAPTAAAEKSGLNGLTEEEQAQVDHLKSEDTRVRNHEAAHASAGGTHAGSPQFSYTNGPDGRRYATSGSVPIDVSPVAGDPEATIRKMEQVRRAALAPADPSGADRSVAAQASKTSQQAQRELREVRAEEAKPEASEEAPTELPGQASSDAKPEGPKVATTVNGQSDIVAKPETGQRFQPGAHESGGARGAVQNSTIGGSTSEPHGFAALTEATDNSSSGSGGGAIQQQTSFTQAIDAYQRAGNASAGPRITSLQ